MRSEPLVTRPSYIGTPAAQGIFSNAPYRAVCASGVTYGVGLEIHAIGSVVQRMVKHFWTDVGRPSSPFQISESLEDEARVGGVCSMVTNLRNNS